MAQHSGPDRIVAQRIVSQRSAPETVTRPGVGHAESAEPEKRHHVCYSGGGAGGATPDERAGHSAPRGGGWGPARPPPERATPPPPTIAPGAFCV